MRWFKYSMAGMGLLMRLLEAASDKKITKDEVLMIVSDAIDDFGVQIIDL